MEQLNPLVSAFGDNVERMQDPKVLANPKPVHITIQTVDPRKELWAGICFYMGDKAQWLPPYVDVARWLYDNKSRGLICVGTCGLGKSLICTKVLPVLFSRHFGKEVLSCTATEMNDRADELLRYCQPGHVIIIDDLGTEPVEVVYDYGKRRRPFCLLVDRAEKTGTMLVITTNLRTTRDTNLQRNFPSIETRYGMPTLDRLRATTKVVLFTGTSLRQ